MTNDPPPTVTSHGSLEMADHDNTSHLKILDVADVLPSTHSSDTSNEHPSTPHRVFLIRDPTTGCCWAYQARKEPKSQKYVWVKAFLCSPASPPPSLMCDNGREFNDDFFHTLLSQGPIKPKG